MQKAQPNAHPICWPKYAQGHVIIAGVGKVYAYNLNSISSIFFFLIFEPTAVVEFRYSRLVFQLNLNT